MFTSLQFNMYYRLLWAVCLGLFCKSFANFENCIQNGGQEIIADICIPTKYDTNILPPTQKPPIIVNMILEVNGLKKVDFLSNTFSTYLSLHRVWKDSRIQVNWQENETVKYLNRNYWDRIWRPKIINPNSVSATEQVHHAMPIEIYRTGDLFLLCHKKLQIKSEFMKTSIFQITTSNI